MVWAIDYVSPEPCGMVSGYTIRGKTVFLDEDEFMSIFRLPI